MMVVVKPSRRAHRSTFSAPTSLKIPTDGRFLEKTSAYSRVTSLSTVPLRLVGVHTSPVMGSISVMGLSSSRVSKP